MKTFYQDANRTSIFTRMNREISLLCVRDVRFAMSVLRRGTKGLTARVRLKFNFKHFVSISSEI